MHVADTLLVVDDDVTICSLLEHVLSETGSRVLTAGSGEEGLRIVTEEPVELALVDIGLPGMSGIELTRQLVKTTTTTVLLMTGDDHNYSYETAVAEGAMDFIVKPIRLGELPLRIERARELKEAVQAKNRMIANLEKLATTDELTQLQNARQFFSCLDAEVGRAHRYQRPLAMALLDIDHFKAVNDRYGHPTGDRVLRHVADVLMSTCRRADSVFRYGGEEFAFLLPESNLDQAATLAERTRARLTELPDVDGIQIRVTISAGVGELQPDERPGEFVRRLDQALYRAKREGRDRVIRSDPPEPGPGEGE
jgi:two-component system, cell cycle response regulator